MSKNTYIIVAVVAIALLGGFLFFQQGDAPQEAAFEPSTPPQSSVTITYTNSGYLPREVRIALGGTVTFKNESSRAMWTATAIHPTHTIYPGSSIQKCGTSEEPRIFDACKDIAQGESWSFTFQEQGSWGYHNHRRTSNTGKIIVE